jgi:hypothetical protein
MTPVFIAVHRSSYWARARGALAKTDRKKLKLSFFDFPGSGLDIPGLPTRPLPELIRPATP